MALLTDGNANDTEALRAYETTILDVAQTESIDLNAKLSLATEEISQEVINVLLDHTSVNYTPLTVAATLGATANARRTMGVADVVVTPQIKRWHALHTLELVYRDAYNNQLNDRYRVKWNEYQQLSGDARVRAIKYGIGLTSRPIPQGAQPVFGVVSGTTLSTTYYASISWASGPGQEGAPSNLTTYQTVDGSALTVTNDLPPAVATGWNLYLGLTGAALALQNGTPLAIGQTFQLPPSGVVAGRAPGTGQAPDVYVTGGWTLNRG